jgi:hypothetical protein
MILNILFLFYNKLMTRLKKDSIIKYHEYGKYQFHDIKNLINQFSYPHNYYGIHWWHTLVF